MTITCDRCQKELEEPGALVFSPPRKELQEGKVYEHDVRKIHICCDCYRSLVTWITSYETQ
jgi:hypothetical protein